MTVISFPRPRLRPNAIQVQFDFNDWTIAYFQDHRFISRLNFPSKVAAEAEARRLAETGMTRRMGKNGTIYIMPDIADGGCWAVAHRSRSEDSDALLGRHFALDDAIVDAVRFAREIGAELCLDREFTDQGGAA